MFKLARFYMYVSGKFASDICVGWHKSAMYYLNEAGKKKSVCRVEWQSEQRLNFFHPLFVLRFAIQSNFAVFRGVDVSHAFQLFAIFYENMRFFLRFALNMKRFSMSPECDCCWHLIKLNLSKAY